MAENIPKKPLVLKMAPPLVHIPTVGSKKPERKIKVGLVQLGNSFSGQCYLPLSVCVLQAYAQKHLKYSEDYEFQLPIYTFLPIPEAVDRLSGCDIVGFSTYVWGHQNSLAIAKELKKQKPNIVTVFGGPQVPDSQKKFRRNKTTDLTAQERKRTRIHFTEDFHHAHPFIDVACHGEGERIFKMILEQMAIDGCHDKRSIPSISYVDRDGVFNFNPKLERMKEHELAQVPSPFTTGIFDRLMAAYPDQEWVGMYETDRGCPYTCTYCDWGGATEDRVSQFPIEQVRQDIDWIGEHLKYCFLCNANFGILPRDVEIAEFFAQAKAKYGRLESINTQNAKNPKKHTILALKVLERAGLNKATVMSQQSLNPETLKAVRRDNMKLDEYYDIQKKLAAEGIYTMTDIILPMPEETYDSIVASISTLIENGQHNRIQFNNLSILVNTEMGDPEYQEHYSYEIVETKIINIHGKKNDSISGIDEVQELVVATGTMPPDMWKKARTLCWGTGLYYFNKLLQPTIIILHKEYGIGYGDILKLLCEEFHSYGDFPVLQEVRDLFLETAQGMREGHEEFIHAPQWLDIWWPPEEYALIKLCVDGKLPAFYDEAKRLLGAFVKQKTEKSLLLLEESLLLNQSLIKLPFQDKDLPLSLNYNILDIYQSVLVGKELPVETGTFVYVIDRTSETWSSWEEWCKKVVWYGNRRGAYIYGNKNPHTEIAGHH